MKSDFLSLAKKVVAENTKASRGISLAMGALLHNMETRHASHEAQHERVTNAIRKGTTLTEHKINL
jgi:hypothetical protein